MATGLILVLIVGALGYLGTIYTSPALILLSICCGVMLFLGYGYILYMMLRVKNAGFRFRLLWQSRKKAL